MFQAVLMFLWTSFVRYVTKRCTGDFLDSMFDTALETFAKCTKTSVDDNLVAKWKGEREKNKEDEQKINKE